MVEIEATQKKTLRVKETKKERLARVKKIQTKKILQVIHENSHYLPNFYSLVHKFKQSRRKDLFERVGDIFCDGFRIPQANHVFT